MDEEDDQRRQQEFYAGLTQLGKTTAKESSDAKQKLHALRREGRDVRRANRIATMAVTVIVVVAIAAIVAVIISVIGFGFALGPAQR
jgi:hypothetical protein